MDRTDYHELMITVVGARKDLGQLDAGLALAKIKEFNSNEVSESIANMRYVYAQTLLELGRIDEAKVWFEKTLISDPDNLTGAKEMLEKCQ
jgi:tetratricopeptide (TPR) repeat protein